MKLKAQINGQLHDLSISEEDGALSVEVDDRRYKLEVHKTGDSSYLLINDLQVYDCRVETPKRSRDRFEVSLLRRQHSVAIIDPRRLRMDENSDRHHHGHTEIAAQMPGKVVRILVEPGVNVEKGDGVVVVEAMKMQNELRSPRAGVVVSINVAAGDTVNAGQVLATVGEPGIENE